MSFLNKLQQIGSKVGDQAVRVGKQLEQSGQQTLTSFKLENEVRRFRSLFAYLILL